MKRFDVSGGTARSTALPAVVLAAALLLAACSTTAPAGEGLWVQRQAYAPSPSEPLYGTWVNPAYNPKAFYPRYTTHPWGLYEMFQTVGSASYAWRGTSFVVEKWVDEQGNTWYKEFVRCSLKGYYSGHAFYLDRVSRDGKTIESVFGNLGWPDPRDLDPETNPTYSRYTRQE